MKNNIYISNSDSFENVIKNFEESLANIEDIFEKQNRNFEKINKTETWTGRTQEGVYKKYKELEGKYDTIESSLLDCIRFMKETLEKYENAEKQIATDLEKNSNELTVN